MRVLGWILIVAGFVVPLGLWLHSAIDQRREDRRFGGPPLEDAFGPAARFIDTVLLLLVGAVFWIPGGLLVWLS